MKARLVFLSGWCLALAVLALAPGSGLAAGKPKPASAKPETKAGETATFGFGGPEIFPIDPAISHLRYADIDGDGLNDLVVVNNARSQITILLNQTGKTNRVELKDAKREINELPPDARFRIVSTASEKRIADILLADLNGDQRPDLVYYGEPHELVVQYNEGTNTWSAPKRWSINDGQLVPGALAAGDFNGDGLTDLVLLGENQMYLFLQKKDHTLAEPEKLPFSGTVKTLMALDIDGDGRDDLLLSNWDSPNPLRFRLQNQSGQLGPEHYFAMPPIRSFWADDLEGDHKTEVITVSQNSGRAAVHKFARNAAEKISGNLSAGQFQVVPLVRTTKPRRGVTWSDVNGDGLPDLVFADPDSAQVTVLLQQPDGTMSAARSFPSFSGITDLCVADWDGDNHPKIFVLSADERQVGVMRFDQNGRLAFPEVIPSEGKPLALAAGALKPGARPVLAMISDVDGKRSLIIRQADGTVRRQKLSESFKGNPSAMTFQDVDQDGLADLVVLIPYEKIKILRQTDAAFEEIDLAPPGGSAEQPWVSQADVDGDGKPELLLAQKNFLRAVKLKGETGSGTNKTWSFAVKDQINGAASNSRIVAAAAVPHEDKTNATLCLLDAEKKALTLCQRDASGVWQTVRSIPLPFTEFNELRPITVGASQGRGLGFVGQNAAGVMALSGSVWELKEVGGYETPIKNARLSDVVTGDLNNDGRKDLVFLETSRHYIDVVIFGPDGKLVPANRWPVFEERSFRGQRGELPEPREAVIADFTGDGKKDLVIMVHDRLLLYPQE